MAFERWLDDGNQDAIIALDGKVEVQDPLEDLFRRVWDQELMAIRADEDCTPQRIGEARLHRALWDAMELVKRSPKPCIGGVRLLDLHDDVVPQVLNRSGSHRYSCRVDLEDQGNIFSIVIAFTNLENSQQMRFFIDAVEGTLQTPVVGAVLLHPARQPRMGEATRGKVNRLRSDDKLRPFPWVDQSDSFERLECYRRFCVRATTGELSLGGHNLDKQEVDDLVVKLGLLAHLNLFDQIFLDWRSSPPQPTTQLAEAGSHPAFPGQAGGSDKEERAAATQPDLRLGTSADDSPDAWARRVQQEVAGQLRNFRLDVESAGIQVGPRFARLLLRPMGSTSVNQVRRKAEDLKTRLAGISTNPLIDSQANAISVNVELPAEFRRPVTLDEMMPSALPDPLEPWFPVGLDVAGKSHWANLSDPTSGHFLVAGTTGSGKSEFLKSLIAGMARRMPPERLQFVLIDPKRVTFNFTGDSPYFRFPVAYEPGERATPSEAMLRGNRTALQRPAGPRTDGYPTTGATGSATDCSGVRRVP